MYFPFFRGKQYELIVIREQATMLANAGFVPIVEPVKESTTGLVRALAEVAKSGGESILIINPANGDHSADAGSIAALVDGPLTGLHGMWLGVLATPSSSPSALRDLCRRAGNRPVSIIHAGYPDGRSLAAAFKECGNIKRHVFLEEHCSKLYRKHFVGDSRVLIRDGFERRPNRAHPPVESFSDLHATFKEEGVDGFGDFLVVGDDFSETGGPAYAVAIHLTFIDRSKDDEMFIHHFISDRFDTPTDPAGKFAEALQKLVVEVRGTGSQIEQTNAVREFLDLHARGHFPGLGYVKKLSMQHHIETLAQYFEGR